MNELQHRILRVLLEKTPQTAAEISKLLGVGYAHSRTMVTLSEQGFLSQQARPGKKPSLWHLEDKGREAAEAPLPEKPVHFVKNAWQKLGGEAQVLLRLLRGGRPVYKRRAQYPCLEKPIQPVPYGRGLSQLIKEGLVDRVAGTLERTRLHERFSWTGDWGRFVINEEGRGVLALDPKKEKADVP